MTDFSDSDNKKLNVNCSENVENESSNSDSEGESALLLEIFSKSTPAGLTPSPKASEVRQFSSSDNETHFLRCPSAASMVSVCRSKSKIPVSESGTKKPLMLTRAKSTMSSYSVSSFKSVSGAKKISTRSLEAELKKQKKKYADIKAEISAKEELLEKAVRQCCVISDRIIKASGKERVFDDEMTEIRNYAVLKMSMARCKVSVPDVKLSYWDDSLLEIEKTWMDMVSMVINCHSKLVKWIEAKNYLRSVPDFYQDSALIDKKLGQTREAFGQIKEKILMRLDKNLFSFSTSVKTQNEQISQCEEICKEQQRSLEKQKVLAEKYEREIESITKQQKEQTEKYLAELSQKKKENEWLKDEVERMRSTNRSITKTVANKEREHKEAMATLNRHFDDCFRREKDCKLKLEEVTDKLGNIQMRELAIKKNQQDIGHAAQLNQKLDAAQKEIKRLHAQIATAQNELKIYQNSMKRVQQEKAEVATLSQLLDDARQEIMRLQSESNMMTGDSGKMMQHEIGDGEQIDSAQIRRLEDLLATAKSESQLDKSLIKDLQNELTKKRYPQETGHSHSHAAALNKQQQQLDSARKEVKRLESQLATASVDLKNEKVLSRELQQELAKIKCRSGKCAAEVKVPMVNSEEIKMLRGENETLNNEIAELKAKMDAKNAAERKIDSEIDLLIEWHGELSEREDELLRQTRVFDIRTELLKFLNKKRGKFKAVRTLYDENKAEVDRLKASFYTLRKRSESMQTHLNRLEEENAQLRSRDSDRLANCGSHKRSAEVRQTVSSCSSSQRQENSENVQNRIAKDLLSTQRPSKPKFQKLSDAQSLDHANSDQKSQKLRGSPKEPPSAQVPRKLCAPCSENVKSPRSPQKVQSTQNSHRSTHNTRSTPRQSDPERSCMIS